MAFTKLEEWSETAASNTEINGIVLSDSTQIDALDNIEREHMAQIAKWLGDDTLASATTTDLGSVPGRYVSVTGTTTITAFGTIKAGTIKTVKFTGALILTYNATSLILPGAANITTIAGDTAEFVSEGSGNWRCTRFTRASSAPYVSGTFTATLVCGTSGTITLTLNTLSYVKIGDMVTITGTISVASVSSPTGTLALGGLPFAVPNNDRNTAAMNMNVRSGTGSAGTNVWQARAVKGTSTIALVFYAPTTGTETGSAATVIRAGTIIDIGGTYFVA